MGLLGTIIGIFLGAWINNVFTWKIKNQIDTLDALYKNLRICNILFKELMPIQQRLCMIDGLQNLENHTYGVVSFNDDPNLTINKLKKQKNNLWIRIETLCGELDHNNAVLNDEFKTCINNFKEPIIRLYNDCSLANEDYIEQYNAGVKLIEKVIESRKRITSFCYMVKELNPFKNMCSK